MHTRGAVYCKPSPKGGGATGDAKDKRRKATTEFLATFRPGMPLSLVPARKP